MSEPGDKVFAIMPSNLFDCTIVRRNGNGTVVLHDDDLGDEYNAEAICVYKVISRIQPPTPSLGPTPEQASTGEPKPEIDICAELRKGLAAARTSEPSTHQPEQQPEKPEPASAPNGLLSQAPTEPSEVKPKRKRGTK